MNKEELKKAIDIVSGIEVHSEAEAIAKEMLISYIELKDKIIDEAIVYIKDEGIYEEDLKVFNDDIDYNKLPDLLKILERGKNNEK